MMMNFIYEDRKPEAGDIVVWDHAMVLTHPRTRMKPYTVLRVSANATSITILNDKDVESSYGNARLKVIKTIRGKYASKGDYIIKTKPQRADVRHNEVVEVISARDTSMLNVKTERYASAAITMSEARVLLCAEGTTDEDCCQEIDAPTTRKGTPMSKRNTRFKVFGKDGKVNYKGLVYQAIKNHLYDKRPFVNELLNKELTRVTDLLISVDWAELHDKAAKAFNVELMVKLEKIAKVKLRIETSIANENPALVLTAEAALIYEVAKETKEIVKHLWIKEYLTKSNLDSVEPVVLFKSNNISIVIKDGALTVNSSRVPIAYNEETKEFHL